MATQAERRAATIARLVDATIETLVAEGYARTTVKAICDRAGLSQGALFRQFDTRLDLIARAVQVIGERHLAGFADALPPPDAPRAPDWSRVVRLVRDLCRSDTHAAWHEVMVAARTDAGLRAAVSTVLRDFEAAVLGSVRAMVPVHPDREAAVAAAMLSVMHCFDSEAVTVAVYGNAAIEAARLTWAAETLRRAVEGG